MSAITTILSTDLITNSRTVINTNFSNLNTDKIETSVLDTDTALTANSDAKVATQKAVKAYVDAGGNVNASETTRGIVEEATDAEVTAGTATGGTSAKLFITPTKLLTYLSSISAVPSKAFVVSTAFETSARFTSIVNAGTNTFNTTGISMDTTGTTTRAAGITMDIGGTTNNLFTGSPVFSASIFPTTIGTTGSSFFGIGLVTKSGSGHTYTTNHAGFKILMTAGPTATLYATNGSGTTETASSALTTLSVADGLEVMLKMNSTTSIDYYYRKNGGSWSTATTISTNLPASASYQLQLSLSNDAVGVQSVFGVASLSYSR